MCVGKAWRTGSLTLTSVAMRRRRRQCLLTRTLLLLLFVFALALKSQTRVHGEDTAGLPWGMVEDEDVADENIEQINKREEGEVKDITTQDVGTTPSPSSPSSTTEDTPQKEETSSEGVDLEQMKQKLIKKARLTQGKLEVVVQSSQVQVQSSQGIDYHSQVDVMDGMSSFERKNHFIIGLSKERVNDAYETNAGRVDDEKRQVIR